MLSLWTSGASVCSRGNPEVKIPSWIGLVWFWRCLLGGELVGDDPRDPPFPALLLLLGAYDSFNLVEGSPCWLYQGGYDEQLGLMTKTGFVICGVSV